jgi:hypothetical protein
MERLPFCIKGVNTVGDYPPESEPGFEARDYTHRYQ